ncbi:MAG: hypothetical protein WCI88_10515 [Chloroflexota bacterium]
MDSKKTILSQKDLALLEAVVLRHGKTASLEQIQEAIGENIPRGAVRKRVAQMSKAGWLIRLKKGLYLVVTDISTLGNADVSELVIAQSLNADSYISFESALQYYGMFDQMLSRIDSVTTKATRKYKVLQTTYSFSQIKQELYFGFTEVVINNQKVKMADKEKTILDMLYFRTTRYSVSMVLEKLIAYRDQFDFGKAKSYCAKYSLGMLRKMGFLFDQAGVDTTDILSPEQTKRNSYNKLTQQTDKFNAKWRLYYDSNLTR